MEAAKMNRSIGGSLIGGIAETQEVIESVQRTTFCLMQR